MAEAGWMAEACWMAEELDWMAAVQIVDLEDEIVCVPGDPDHLGSGDPSPLLLLLVVMWREKSSLHLHPPGYHPSLPGAAGETRGLFNSLGSEFFSQGFHTLQLLNVPQFVLSGC